MPIIVDREKEKEKIIQAFCECLKSKPFDKITIRDIAKEAGMAAPTVLTYYKTRDDIILAFIDYTLKNTFRLGEKWAEEHHRADYSSDREYIRGLFDSNAKFSEERKLSYTGALNTYLMAQYEPQIQKIVHQEMASWSETIFRILVDELKIKNPDPNLARLIFTTSVGFCMDTYNGWFDEFSFISLREYFIDIILNIAGKEKMTP